MRRCGVAVCRDRLASVDGVQRGLAAVSVAESGGRPGQAGEGEGEGAGGAERAEEWWVALTSVLGQPSEQRRRAAWEALAGTLALRGAGLEWAEVEARVRAAGAVAAAAGSVRAPRPAVTAAPAAARARRPARVWTGSEVVETVADGSVVDLGGREVVLTRAAVVVGVGKVGTLRNGTVRVVNATFEMIGALRAVMGGELRLEGVRVVGTGIVLDEGRASLVGAEVVDSPNTGIVVMGVGSKVAMQGGRIAAVANDGVLVNAGAQAELRDAEVADCGDCGVTCNGTGSKVVIQGGRIAGSRGTHGLTCQEGAYVEMRGVEIVNSQQCGFLCSCHGSKVVMRGGRIAGCPDMHGVCCREGGEAEVVDVQVSECGQDGVTSLGEGSKVVMRGGRVVQCELHGVDCNRGGRAEVSGVVISECGSYGLLSSGGSLTHSGCTVTGCGRGARFGC